MANTNNSIISTFRDTRSGFTFDADYHRSITKKESKRIARNVVKVHITSLLKCWNWLCENKICVSDFKKKAEFFRHHHLPSHIQLLSASTEIYLKQRI
jgi:hypothetical protein